MARGSVPYFECLHMFKSEFRFLNFKAKKDFDVTVVLVFGLTFFFLAENYTCILDISRDKHTHKYTLQKCVHSESKILFLQSLLSRSICFLSFAYERQEQSMFIFLKDIAKG